MSRSLRETLDHFERVSERFAVMVEEDLLLCTEADDFLWIAYPRAFAAVVVHRLATAARPSALADLVADIDAELRELTDPEEATE